jgi:hypothetical protein
MKLLHLAATLVLSSILSACGGGDAGPATAAPPAVALTLGSVQVQPSPFKDAVQQLYLAYFGRAADPGGLANFESQMAALGAPADVQALAAAYYTNPGIRALVDSFSSSAESQALYGGTTTAFVTAIYGNIFNRTPDDDGLKYWVTAIDSGSLSRGGACLSILAGALANTTPQGLLDAQVIANKVKLSNQFTDSLSTNSNASLYVGNDAALTVRKMLATITAATAQSDIDQLLKSTISTLSTAVMPRADISGALSANTNSVVNLSGSGSFNPLQAVLSYNWELTSRPTDSTTRLIGASSASVAFIPDRAGTYVVVLTVDNGRAKSKKEFSVAAVTVPIISTPVGATAICKDGTYSYSATRRGTCSHHGGVLRWL